MTSNRTKFFIVVGVLGLGISMGRCGAGEVETVTKVRIVKVPTVKTHVEYRDRYVKLPESCTEAAKLLTEDTKDNGTMTEAAGQIVDALSKLGLGKVQQDIQAINKSTETINAAKSRLDLAATDNSKATGRITAAISRCQKEVNDGPS